MSEQILKIVQLASHQFISNANESKRKLSLKFFSIFKRDMHGCILIPKKWIKTTSTVPVGLEVRLIRLIIIRRIS